MEVVEKETRILMVEDLPADARRNEREIRKVLPACQFRRVETREGFIEALDQFQPELIVSNSELPGLDSLSALAIASGRCPGAPFIVVAKGHIRRLGPAILSALESRQDAGEALRESEERFRRAVVHAPIPAAVHAGDGRVLLVNEAWTSQSGYGSDDMPTLDVWAEKAFGARKDPILSRIQALHSSETRLDEGEFTIRTKAGEERIWRFSSIPLGHLPDGGTLVMTMAIDVTERRRNEEERSSLEEQLRQARKVESTGRLAGVVAHDVNDLLTVINGRSDLLLDPLMEGDPLWVHLNEIRQAGARAAELAQQLLAFSRRQTLQIQPVSANDVIAGMARTIERLTGVGVQLVTHLAPGLARISVDEGQLHQVLLNLAAHAKEAMPHGGSLTLTTRNVTVERPATGATTGPPPGAYVLLQVSDTGAGPGLAAVRGMVREMGGWIRVISQPGQGASVQLLFPQLPQEALASPPRTEVDVNLRGSETILVVEEQRDVRAFVAAVLRSYGYQVLEAPQGGDALLIAEHHAGPVHLMLSDVRLPRMSGTSLANRLSRLRPEMRVLLMSAVESEIGPVEEPAHPSVAFLHKPFTPRTLAVKIREILGSGSPAR